MAKKKKLLIFFLVLLSIGLFLILISYYSGYGIIIFVGIYIMVAIIANTIINRNAVTTNSGNGQFWTFVISFVITVYLLHGFTPEKRKIKQEAANYEKSMFHKITLSASEDQIEALDFLLKKEDTWLEIKFKFDTIFANIIDKKLLETNEEIRKRAIDVWDKGHKDCQWVDRVKKFLNGGLVINETGFMCEDQHKELADCIGKILFLLNWRDIHLTVSMHSIPLGQTYQNRSCLYTGCSITGSFRMI